MSCKNAPEAGNGEGWLIVQDDLVDTGETAKALRQMLPKAHFATAYAKPAGRPLVDTFVTEVSQALDLFPMGYGTATFSTLIVASRRAKSHFFRLMPHPRTPILF